jgi:hypothetical protein
LPGFGVKVGNCDFGLGLQSQCLGLVLVMTFRSPI